MKRRATVWVVALAVLVLDQATKAWALHSLSDGHRVALVGDWLGLRLVSNSGAAFSLLEGHTWIVTAVMLAVLGALIWFHGRAHRWWGAVIFGAAIGGALGNLGDRLFRAPSFGQGHVVDMIEYGDWFVGNVADIAVVGAAIAAVIISWTPLAVMEPREADVARDGSE